MKKIILFITIVLLLCSSCSQKNGFVDEGDYTYYYVNGEIQKGWQFIDDNWYYFRDKSEYDDDIIKRPIGSMWKGSFYDDNNKKYVLDEEDGKMITGWHQFNNNSNRWWYFDPETGEGVTGWKEIDGELYNFDQMGELNVSQWIDGNYYVDESGRMLSNGWYKIDGSEYYIDSNGKVDRTKNHNEELKKMNQQNNQNKYNQKKRSLTYEDIYGTHTINFILPQLPVQTQAGLTINDIDIKYSVNKDLSAGVNIWIICSGTKDTYAYPQLTIYVEGETSRVFVAQPSSDSNFLKSSFRVSTDIEEIFTIERELTFELSFMD